MRKLAVCIPTYNRPEVIREFLIKCASLYDEYDVDIHIYDSSEANDTENIVYEFQEKYTNLEYVHIDSSVHSNLKVYRIYQAFQKQSKYEYMWICSDSIRWTEETIKRIKEELENNYDLLVVNYRDKEAIGTREYTEKNELFVDCAWHMTLYGATIIRIKTVLDNVDWMYLEERYTIPERINHSHVALYFEQLNKMNEFLGLHLSIANKNLIASPLKKVSGWHKETFYVWCKCWPSMINALPECYKNKDAVIKKSGVNSGILNLENFLQLRKSEIFTYDIYKKYIGSWNKLTDVNPFFLFLLAIMPNDFFMFLSLSATWEKRLKKKIKLFCKEHKKIYIYGAGQKANRYAKYLEEMFIKYEGFVVSATVVEKEILRGHSVMQYKDDLLDDIENGIILALNIDNTADVFEKNILLKESTDVFSEYKEEFSLNEW